MRSVDVGPRSALGVTLPMHRPMPTIAHEASIGVRAPTDAASLAAEARPRRLGREALRLGDGTVHLIQLRRRLAYVQFRAEHPR